MKNYFYNVLSFLVLTLSVHNAGAANTDEWKSVAKWKPFGARWALAYDEAGHMTAIYDLAFPEWHKKINLGRLTDRADIKNQIREDVTFAQETLGVDSKEVQETLSEANNLPAETIEDKVIAELTDVSLDSKTASVIHNAQEVLTENGDVEISENLLNNLHFENVKERDYTLTWDGSNVQEGKKISAPKKICDLNSMKWAFIEGAKVFGINVTLSELAGINGPTIAGAAVGLALDRFFHFYNLLLRTHQSMLLEALVSMDDENSLYSKETMDPEDRRKAIEALTFTQVPFELMWTWKNKSPAKEWEKTWAAIKENEKQNLKWIGTHQEDLTPINSRFAWTKNTKGETDLVVLGSRKPHRRKGPTIAIDYGHLDRLRHQRMEKEIVNSAVIFETNLIPWFGFALKRFYKHYVESSVDTDKVWEGRLEIALEDLASRFQQDFALEFATLHRQQINPLMGASKDTQDLVEARRHLLGL